METVEILEILQQKARRDETVRRTLLETRKAADPLAAFCKAGREMGYELYPMDLIVAGEEFYAAMRRSTNGGGENTPSLEFEDDYFEILMTELEMMR